MARSRRTPDPADPTPDPRLRSAETEVERAIEEIRELARSLPAGEIDLKVAIEEGRE